MTVWSPPAELAEIAPYQLVRVAQEAGARLCGRAVPGERLEIGDNVTLESVIDPVSLYRKTK